jgi:diguanylate cyclase (GGDEF)-like protein/PAS domain S-box-containing protein
MRAGIRAVLQQRSREFRLDYTRPTGGGPRWYSVRVSPCGGDVDGAVIAHIDITAIVLAEQAARSAAQQLAAMTSAVPGVLYQGRQRPGGKWQFIWVSDAIRDLFELEPEQVMRDHHLLSNCIVAEDRASRREAVQKSTRSLGSWIHEHRIRTPSGRIKWVRGQALPQREPDGAVLWSGIMVDITERKQTEVALAESEERWKFALEGSGEGVWDWNIRAATALFSPRWREMFGYSASDVLDPSTEWSSRVHPDDLPTVMAVAQEHLDGKSDFAAVEFRMLCKDGGWRWTLGRGKLVSRDADGNPLRFVGTNSDIAERKVLEDQLQLLAFYDPLTRLPNRRLLNKRLSQTLAGSRQTGRVGALMFLDLDHFKTLNDQHGHAAGDLLLVEAARRLRFCVREADTVARFGGDEFVLMIGALHSDRQGARALASVIAEKVRSSLSEPYLLTLRREGQEDATIEHRCSVSIGIALFSGVDDREEDLLRLADRAMYKAKLAGRGTIEFA